MDALITTENISWVETAFSNLKARNYSGLESIVSGINSASLSEWRDRGFLSYYKAKVLFDKGRHQEVNASLEDSIFSFVECSNIPWILMAKLFQANNARFIGTNESTICDFKGLLDLLDYFSDRRLQTLALNDFALFLYSHANDLDGCKKHLNQSLEYTREIGNQRSALLILANLLGISCEAGDKRAALLYSKEAIELLSGAKVHNNEYFLESVELTPSGFSSLDSNVSHLCSTIYLNYAGVLTDTGDLEQGLLYCTKALDILSETGQEYLRAVACNQIARINHAKGNLDSALQYYIEAKEIFSTINERSSEHLTVLCNIADVAAEQHEHATAKHQYSAALELAEVLELPKEQARILCHLGNLYLMTGHNTTAISLLEKALNLAQKFSLYDTIVQSFRLLGTAHLTIDSSKSKDYLLNALLLADEQGLKIEQRQIHKELKGYYKMYGDSASALVHFEKFYLLHEEIFNEEADVRMKNLQALFEVNQFKHNLELKAEKIKLLESELDASNRELGIVAIKIIEKQGFMHHVEKGLIEILTADYRDKDDRTADLLASIRRMNNTNKDWAEFGQQFERAHKDFVECLLKLSPEITSAELRVCILLRLSLNTKQIADLLKLSSRSIENHRTHIRRKLSLAEGKSLTQHLISLNSTTQIHE